MSDNKFATVPEYIEAEIDSGKVVVRIGDEVEGCISFATLDAETIYRFGARCMELGAEIMLGTPMKAHTILMHPAGPEIPETKTEETEQGELTVEPAEENN